MAPPKTTRTIGIVAAAIAPIAAAVLVGVLAPHAKQHHAASTSTTGSGVATTRPTWTEPPTPPLTTGPMATGQWSHPVTVLENASQSLLIGLGCPSIGQCMAAYDGPTCESGGNPEKDFCASGNGVPSTFTGNGTVWEPQGQMNVTDSGSILHCNVQGSCGILTLTTLTIATGGDLSAPLDINPTTIPDDVSCPTASFCVVVDGNGNAQMVVNQKVMAPQRIDGDPGFYGLEGVSCTSADFCMAVDDNGRAMTFDGTVWSAPHDIDGTHKITDLMCATNTSCAAIDDQGRLLTWDGSWSLPVSVLPGADLVALSCPSPNGCAAIDKSGNVYMEGPNGWTGPTQTGDPHAVDTISCPSTNWCVAGDENGDEVTWSGTS